MKLLLINLAFISIAVNFGSSIYIKPNEVYNIHAVLVAGSNTYDNYRHQANVCHAYHILRNHGVPAENIIVMMYDDIANSSLNPYPGKIFNVPNGTDVYAGVVKDYTGGDVTSENFIKVLKGDSDLASQGKKVLTSGSNDHVFIYFSDHGTAGGILFPTETLSSNDLNEALIYMHDNGLYDKLTFYLEACEAGSMFYNILPENINIYATTSTAPGQLGFATYCDWDVIGTCLSDEYSAAWMADSENNDITTETLDTQFKNIVQATVSSTPQQFGNKSLAELDAGQFQGESKSTSTVLSRKLIKSRDSVSSRDVPLHGLRRRIANAYKNNRKDLVNQLQLQLDTLVSGRQFYDRAIRMVISELCLSGYCSKTDDVLSAQLPLVDHRSFSIVTKTFETKCINVAIHSYGAKYMYALANIVQSNNFHSQSDLERFINRLQKACADHIVDHGYETIV